MSVEVRASRQLSLRYFLEQCRAASWTELYSHRDCDAYRLYNYCGYRLVFDVVLQLRISISNSGETIYKQPLESDDRFCSRLRAYEVRLPSLFRDRGRLMCLCREHEEADGNSRYRREASAERNRYDSAIALRGSEFDVTASAGTTQRLLPNLGFMRVLGLEREDAAAGFPEREENLAGFRGHRGPGVFRHLAS